MLAGLPQYPSGYQLSNNYEAAKKRQKQVIVALERYNTDENKQNLAIEQRELLLDNN